MAEIIVGKETFKTNAAAESRARALRDMPIGTTWTSGPDFEFLHAACEMHAWSEDLLGDGITKFEVVPNPKYPSGHGLKIHHRSTPPTLFSTKECWKADTYPRRKYIKVCRYEVRDQIETFKQSVFKNSPATTCPVTKDVVFQNECDVHHKKPQTFDKLASTFAKENSIDFTALRYVKESDVADVSLEIFADRKLGEAWQAYHAKRAKLCVISREGHLLETVVDPNDPLLQ